MKIGIDIRAIGQQRTGDESYTLNLVQNLAKIDKENQYFLYTNTNKKEALEKIETILDIENENFKITPVLPARKALWTFWSLPRYLRKNPVDVLHVQYIAPLKLPKNIKLVTTIHDVSFNRYPKFISKKDLFFLNLLIKPSLKRADKILAISEFTKQEILKYYPQIKEEKITTIYNGGAPEEFFQPASQRERERLTKKFDLADPFLLYVGTLQPRKNVPLLMKAFALLKKKYPQDPLVQSLILAIGGKQSGHNYDKKIDQLYERIEKKNPEVAKKIQFLGYVDQEDMPTLFQAASIFCLPSLYEGFGLPLVEAMASGTPVLCSESSCHGEITNGAAILHGEKNSNDLGQKIYSLLTDPAQREGLTEKGKTQAEKFSWEKCARETLALYKSIF